MAEKTLKISLVVAAALNNAIGKDNQLLWHLPKDLRYFKHVTWAMPVIMGRKTYESFNKHLAGRINIVITRQQGWSAPNVTVVNSLEAALEAASATDCREAFVIGGGEIYREALPLADLVYLTRVQVEKEGDTFFPELPAKDWELASRVPHHKDDKNAYDFAFEVWKKR